MARVKSGKIFFSSSVRKSLFCIKCLIIEWRVIGIYLSLKQKKCKHDRIFLSGIISFNYKLYKRRLLRNIIQHCFVLNWSLKKKDMTCLHMKQPWVKRQIIVSAHFQRLVRSFEQLSTLFRSKYSSELFLDTLQKKVFINLHMFSSK